MPQVKDKITGKVISRQPYNKEGADTAASIAKSNPNWDVSYATNDARSRSQVNQAGSGMAGFSGIGSIPQYDKGGKTKLEKYKKGDKKAIGGKISPGDIRWHGAREQQWDEAYHDAPQKEGGKIDKYKKGGKAFGPNRTIHGIKVKDIKKRRRKAVVKAKFEKYSKVKKTKDKLSEAREKRQSLTRERRVMPISYQRTQQTKEIKEARKEVRDARKVVRKEKRKGRKAQRTARKATYFEDES
jgi:hypothetical protein